MGRCAHSDYIPLDIDRIFTNGARSVHFHESVAFCMNDLDSSAVPLEHLVCYAQIGENKNQQKIKIRRKKNFKQTYCAKNFCTTMH